MGFKRCPGSSAFSQPRIELLRCPHCGSDVEVWSDEADGTCAQCGRPVCRTTTQSCVDWCKYAKECLGEEKHKKYQETKALMRKEALLRAAEDRFGWDAGRKEYAVTVLKYAEQILKEQPEADPNIVVAAAVLSVARGNESQTGAPAGSSAEAVGRESAAILEELNYPHGFVRHVCEIITSPSSGLAENVNWRALHDARLLAAHRTGGEGSAAGSMDEAILQAFLTPVGRRIAESSGRRGEILKN